MRMIIFKRLKSSHAYLLNRVTAMLMAVTLFVVQFFALPVTVFSEPIADFSYLEQIRFPDERETLKVGWFDSQFFYYSADDRRAGYAYEFLEDIAAFTGWKYDFVVGSWSQLFMKLQRGEIDILADVSYTDERASQMLFTVSPMGDEWYIIYVDENNTNIDSDHPETLNGKNVGVNTNSLQQSLFIKWEQDNGVQANIVPLNCTGNEAKEMMKQGQIDAMVSIDSFEDMSGTIPIAKVGEANIFFAINKNRPDVKLSMDKAMNSILSTDRYYTSSLYSNYCNNNSLYKCLSMAERGWINAHQTIRVGYLDNFMAFCGKDKNTGGLTGALKEYLNDVSNCFSNAGLSFTPVSYSSIEDAVEALQRGDIDCVFPVNFGTYEAVENNLLISSVVNTSKMYVLVPEQKSSSFSLDNDCKAAVIKGNLNEDIFVHDNYKNWSTTEFDSEEACMNAVARGEADCMVVNNYRLNSLVEMYRDYKLVEIPTGISTYLSFAVSRDNLCLLTILDRAINVVPKDSMNSYLANYSLRDRHVGIKDFIMGHMPLFVAVILIIIALISFLLYRSTVIGNKMKQLNAILGERKKKLQESKEEQQQQLQRITELYGELSDNQKKIQEALNLADQANQAKTVFLNNMSHDIRTPMNAIVGFTGLASKHVDDPIRAKEYLDKIMISSRHLVNLINDVLDMSRIESGNVKLELQHVNLHKHLDDLRTIISSTAKENNIELVMESNNLKAHLVECDPLRLNQVLINLIGNAIKFTKPGGKVTVSIIQLEGEEIIQPKNKDGESNDEAETREHIHESTGEEGSVAVLKSGVYHSYEFHVKDTGIGMSQEFMKHIYEAFSREETPVVNKIQGTGLGMAITKNIVDMMNGRIIVESKQGKGSEFTVLLKFRQVEDAEGVIESDNITVDYGSPLNSGASYTKSIVASNSETLDELEETENEAVNEASIKSAFNGKKLLLVEDNEFNMEIAVTILEEIGFQVAMAADGAIAVEMVQQAKEGDYDAILMDIQMPNMNGYEATRYIRGLDYYQHPLATIPIIAMTANAYEEDKKLAKEAGMNAHLTKPIDVDKLMKVLQEIIKSSNIT